MVNWWEFVLIAENKKNPGILSPFCCFVVPLDDESFSHDQSVLNQNDTQGWQVKSRNWTQNSEPGSVRINEWVLIAAEKLPSGGGGGGGGNWIVREEGNWAPV